MYRVVSTVQKGKLEPWKGKALQEIVSKFEGKVILITAQEFHKSITNPQMRFLHGVFLPALRELYKEQGIDLSFETLKETFKAKFGELETVYHPDGSVTHQPKSIAKWGRKEANEAMERARAEYANYGQLPFPTKEEIE